MNIFKDRAIWIVLVLIVMAGSAYMILVDPDRIDKMENIVERDDIRIADVNEVKELFDRLDLKLNFSCNMLAPKKYINNSTSNLEIIEKINNFGKAK